MFEFINTLTESSLLTTEQALKKYTARDIADIAFLNFLALQILRSEFDSRPYSAEYAKKTLAQGGFDNFKTSANDLYLLLYTLFGKNNKSAIKLLKNQQSSDLLLNDLSFNYQTVKSWLSDVSSAKETSNQDKINLMKIESMLKIQDSNYKAVRRLINEWADLEQQEKQIAVTRVLIALRARASKSELLKELEKLSKNNKLEIEVANNPEKDTKDLNLTPAIIGVAIGAGLVAKSIKNFLKDAATGKKY